MAKIHVTSGNGNELEGGHDQWKDWILEWVPSEVDDILERYDPSIEKFANRSPLTDGSSVSAPPLETMRPEPMVHRAPTPRPVFHRHGETAPAPAQATKPAPQITITTTMTPSPRNHVPRFQKPVDPAEAIRQRRAAAQERFQQQVRAARAHAADVMSKIGNAK
jgi:hypothetical protein